MRKLLYVIIGCLAICGLGVMAQSGKIVSVKAAMDSAYIIMGQKTAVHVEVIGELDGTGFFVPNDSLWKDVEISSESEAVIKDLGNNRKSLSKDIIIQGFDSGLYSLPTIAYVQGNETIAANKVTLKVIPVNVDTLTTIHDYADVESAGHNFFDFVPDWISDYGVWVLLALIVIAASIFVYVKYLRKGRIPLLPTKKVVPPYEAAIGALNRLASEHLCERGEEKQFYTRLTDILRVYLDKRFGINAMEMTSSEITKSLRANEETRTSENMMAEILEIADFVKFAKVRPLPEDNNRALHQAISFVENTKPVEQSKNEAEVKDLTK